MNDIMPYGGNLDLMDIDRVTELAEAGRLRHMYHEHWKWRELVPKLEAERHMLLRRISQLQDKLALTRMTSVCSRPKPDKWLKAAIKKLMRWRKQ